MGSGLLGVAAGPWHKDYMQDDQPPAPPNTRTTPKVPEKVIDNPPRPREIGGPKGLEPTRYGDWEVNGRCTDF